MSATAFKRTQLRDLYDALAVLKHSEQTALAVAHSADVSMLNHRLTHDLRTVAKYPPIAGVGLVGKGRTSFPAPFDAASIGSTIEFASAIHAGTQSVDDHPELAFTYVEREVVPLNGSPLARRSMDLLLRAADGTPVLGELKRGPDNLPYYALIQLLVHAVELSSPMQRERLLNHGFSKAEVARPVDLVLIAYGEPHKTHQSTSFDATKAIAAKLLAGPESPLSTFVRRIAYLRAAPNGSSLSFSAGYVAEARATPRI